jgi:hypothetical protein
MAGGIAISAGVLQADAEGCLGTGKIVFDTTSNRQLVFNAANATFPNDIEQTVYYAVGWNIGHIKFLTTTTLSGAITSPGGDLMLDLNVSGTTATFTGSVDTGDNEFMLDQKAAVYLSCPVRCSCLRVARTGYSETGKVYLSSNANSIRRIWMRGGDVIPTVSPNAFGGAELYHYWRWGEQDRCRFDLGGQSQTIASIDSALPSPDGDGNPFGQNSANGGTIWSASAATLTMTGGVTYAGNQEAIARFRVNNAISLVLDAPDFTQTFMERAHLTTGTITVSNGTFRVVDVVNFKNVPTITVEANGTLETAVTNGTVFSGCRTCTVNGKLTMAEGTVFPFSQNVLALSLGANAELSLPAGKALYPASLTINGVAKGPGAYTPSNTPQIRSGAIIITGGSAVWTGGGGADSDVETADNWGGTMPDILYGSSALRFASGGTEALLGGAYTFGDTILSASGGFSFRAGSADALITATGDIRTEKDVADEGTERQYAFAMPVLFDKTFAPTNSVATNDTVTFAAGLICSNANQNVTKVGFGTMVLCDGTMIARNLDVQEGKVILKGLIATPDHVDQGSAGNSIGWTKEIYISNGKKPLLVVDGATVEKPIYGSRDPPLITSADNTVNTFKGSVVMGSPATSVRANGADAKLVFEGGFASTWSVTCGGGGTIEFYDHATRTNSWRAMTVGAGTRVVFEGTKNKVTDGIYFAENNGILDFRESYAFLEPLPLFYFGYLYGGNVYTNTLCLNATTQQVVNIYCKGSNAHPGVIIGDEGSQLEISGYGTNTVNWAGGVSLLKTGSGLLRMSKKAFSSTGSVAVAGGVLEFADGGSWTNGQSVSVGGTGKLVVSEPSTFSKEITLSLDGEGVISIADGVSVKADALYVGDGRMQPGRYTYATAPEPVKSHLDPLAGGAIVVKRGGSAFIIR